MLGTRVEVRGRIEFNSNDGAGIDGGALYLTSHSQVELHRGADLVFKGNQGV